MEIGRIFDPRIFQITFLGGLLGAGVLLRDFSLHPLQIVATFCTGLATQAFWLHALTIKKAGYLSAIITCFGLCILLRADTDWIHPVAAFLAISSKFVLRVKGKHVWNPANAGVLLALLFLPGAWVSSGQWGSDIAYAGWFIALGCLVTSKARRLGIGWMFLLAFMGLLGARVLMLGQNWSVFLHQMQSGALLLFAFFMISDPMTIPNHPRMRLLYAAFVASLAFAWQFWLYRPNSLIWALLIASPLVPMLDQLQRGDRFDWLRPRTGHHV